MGLEFSIVVWFMILQHVPRSALLSLASRAASRACRVERRS
jgi:hypothetical protein